MGDRLATIDMGRKLGALPPFWGGRAGFPPNTMSLEWRPTFIPSGTLIHPAIWPQQISAKNWGTCPFGRGGTGCPSDTMWPVPRPIGLPSFLFMRPTVWSQYTNVTDRLYRQTDRTGQRSDSIGRIVSQTVAQKTRNCKSELTVHADTGIY